jgi:hypothetical protein
MRSLTANLIILYINCKIYLYRTEVAIARPAAYFHRQEKANFNRTIRTPTPRPDKPVERRSMPSGIGLVADTIFAYGLVIVTAVWAFLNLLWIKEAIDAGDDALNELLLVSLCLNCLIGWGAYALLHRM